MLLNPSECLSVDRLLPFSAPEHLRALQNLLERPKVDGEVPIGALEPIGSPKLQ